MITKNSVVVFVNPYNDLAVKLYGVMGITIEDESNGKAKVLFNGKAEPVDCLIDDLDVYEESFI